MGKISNDCWRLEGSISETLTSQSFGYLIGREFFTSVESWSDHVLHLLVCILRPFKGYLTTLSQYINMWISQEVNQGGYHMEENSTELSFSSSFFPQKNNKFFTEKASLLSSIKNFEYFCTFCTGQSSLTLHYAVRSWRTVTSTSHTASLWSIIFRPVVPSYAYLKETFLSPKKP